MRVFPALMVRARAAGARRLTFVADLSTALADPENGVGEPTSWIVSAERASAVGRSGEEALRNLVDALEARS